MCKWEKREGRQSQIEAFVRSFVAECSAAKVHCKCTTEHTLVSGGREWPLARDLDQHCPSQNVRRTPLQMPNLSEGIHHQGEEGAGKRGKGSSMTEQTHKSLTQKGNLKTHMGVHRAKAPLRQQMQMARAGDSQLGTGMAGTGAGLAPAFPPEMACPIGCGTKCADAAQLQQHMAEQHGCPLQRLVGPDFWFAGTSTGPFPIPRLPFGGAGPALPGLIPPAPFVTNGFVHPLPPPLPSFIPSASPFALPLPPHPLLFMLAQNHQNHPNPSSPPHKETNQQEGEGTEQNDTNIDHGAALANLFRPQVKMEERTNNGVKAEGKEGGGEEEKEEEDEKEGRKEEGEAEPGEPGVRGPPVRLAPLPAFFIQQLAAKRYPMGGAKWALMANFSGTMANSSPPFLVKEESGRMSEEEEDEEGGGERTKEEEGTR